jgi:predicted dehydrogenase
MKKLGAAVIGLGVGEQHARAFARDGRCVLRRICDLDASRMARVASELGQGRPAECFEAVLADPEVDVVAIATYDHEHGPQVLAALDAGKHVFCEKPLCHSRAELEAIVAARRRNPDRHLSCNLVLRAAPLYRSLKEKISAGELGTIYAFDGDYLYGRLHKIIEGWRGRVDDYSVMQGGGVHLVDLMHWLTGQRPLSVTATGNQIASRGTSFRYRDFACAAFTFESGLVGRITANFGCVHPHQHVVRVFGTAATFLYDDRGPRLHRSREPELAPLPLAEAPLPVTKGELIPGFVSRILEQGDPSADARHELEVIAACIAADEAQTVSQPVRISYP